MTRKCFPILALCMGLLYATLPDARAVSAGAAKALGHAIADVVEQVMPAVVVVRTETTRYRLAQDWYFGRLYRIPERLAGMGSGIIITKDGYVLTNRHVIDGAQQIEVVLNDGAIYPAKLMGEDPQTDVAVLRIDDAQRKEFPHLEPGDSDALRVGEFVMAIGSPFSLSSSVTLGIVSQKGRSIGALPYEDFIQTDAAVNRGNSGGPLVDMEGRVVGINTIIQTSGLSEGNIGISFAIPINLAMTVARSLIKDGNWRRPWIGILMTEDGDQVSIARVSAQSPAMRAGLRPGDVIRAIDGVSVRQARDVQRAIMSRSVGDSVKLSVLRDKKTIEFTLTPESMPAPASLFSEE